MGGAYLTKRVQTPVWFFILLLLMFAVGQYIGIQVILESVAGSAGTQVQLDHHHLRTPASKEAAGSIGGLNDVANVPLPVHTDGTPLGVEERLRYLELKTNAHFNFGSNPFFGSQTTSKCGKVSELKEYGCVPGEEGYEEDTPLDRNCAGHYEHQICLDRLPQPNTKFSGDPPCLVYDFGVRDMPSFGKTMAKVFGCEVHAFDPSPVSIEWWDSNRAKDLREMENYEFHPYGAGGIDGDLTLNEYDWGQVSIIKYPSYLVDCTDYDPKLGYQQGSGCKLKGTGTQKQFSLPVKTLPTIIKELGHEGRTIDILKVDVEGSEFVFLENVLDHTGGCPDFIEQVAIEWHHMPWDVKYGEGSSPSINAIATLLHTCGLKMFWRHSPGGWPSPEKIFLDLDMKDVRYNAASFHREH